MADLNANNVLTLIQALQLVGLIPSLFVIFLLLALIGRSTQAVVPVLYFLSLSCTFALPLADIYLAGPSERWLEGGLLLGESLQLAFSFLLVLQFLSGRIPPFYYWLVLAVPLIGGSSLIYAALMQAGDCATEQACRDAETYKVLYNVFASSLVFLLLVYYSSRFSGALKDDAHRRHKYWLIVALILLNLCVLAIELALLAGRLAPAQAELTIAVLRLSFIYLVITSLFRVFYPMLGGQVANMMPEKPLHNPSADAPHVEKIESLLKDEKVYREMRLNRAALAAKVGIGEHVLSRLINHYLGKSFNELINHYRIEEAKQRLKNEPNHQITLIGFEVGFNSIASFNRVFKESVGMSPTEYRAREV